MIYDFIHDENAFNQATGTTNDNKIDIIKGKYQYYAIDCLDDIALKIEYKELGTYFYCYKGKMLHETENKEIANEWKAKRKKVRKVTGKHRVIIEWENILSDGKYTWEETKNHENNIILTDKQKEGIRNKLIYMNNKYKKEVLI
jgi:hypothetical protein